MSSNVHEIVLEIMTRYGLQVLGAVAILVVGVIVARWVGGLADQRFQKTHMEPPMRILLVRVIRILILVMATLVALDKFGFSVAPLVAGLGVAGLGAGLALQGVFSNLVAGLTIIFTKPFRIGEYIEINNVRGDVAVIELSTTTLIQADLSRVIVPNRKIVGEILHNFGTMRQLTLTIRVPHATDLNAALQAAHQVAMQSARVLKDPAPSAGIASVDDTGIKIAVWAWVKVVDVVPAEPELYQSFVEAFRARGIGVPVAAHQVRLLEAGG
jgi:small conductance mechanosensitive channel